MLQRVKELTTTVTDDLLRLCVEADTTFSVPAHNDITTACSSYGHIVSPNSPDPSRFVATGSSLQVAVVGKTSEAVFQAINCKGLPCLEPVLSSAVELVSELTGTRTQGSVERTGQSQYKISYHPTIKGRHQLHIKVGRQHIYRSPFTITATSPVEKLGTPILSLEGVKGASYVAVNNLAGEVVVTTADCVSVFSPNGKKLLSFGSQGSGQGQFKNPCGVAVDHEGNILVADYNNHRIQKFTANGQFLAAVGFKGNGRLQFFHPCDIAFNSHNKKLYITDSNPRVQVLNSDLSYSSTFGRPGSTAGHFNYPRGIACDSTGNVYVADCGNNSIQVFTGDGIYKYCQRFRHDPFCPTGIAVDANDQVFVSEDWPHKVTIFAAGLVPVTSFRCRRGWLRGIAVGGGGVVYLCDSIRDCVYVM